MTSYLVILVLIVAAVCLALWLYRHTFGWGDLSEGLTGGVGNHHVSSRNEWGFPMLSGNRRRNADSASSSKEPWGW